MGRLGGAGAPPRIILIFVLDVLDLLVDFSWSAAGDPTDFMAETCCGSAWNCSEVLGRLWGSLEVPEGPRNTWKSLKVLGNP